MVTESKIDTGSARGNALGGSAEWFAVQHAHALHGQIDAALRLVAKSTNPAVQALDVLGPASPYMQELIEFYRSRLALSRMLDSSDLLIHAEGPAAAEYAPRLNAVNWLCTNTERNLKKLVQSLLPGSQETSRRQTEGMDLRLTGMAPGSLYLGFALADIPSDDLVPDIDGALLKGLRSAIHALPVVPQFVGTNSVDPEIVEALPDPAVRDAAMLAAYDLSPTGQRGIHTVEVSAPRGAAPAERAPQSLGQKERVVLRESLRRAPLLRRVQEGTFTGVLRGVDLDTGRVTLRQVAADIPSIRGVVHGDRSSLKTYLDKPVRVKGQFESDAAGRPRMIIIQEIGWFTPPML